MGNYDDIINLPHHVSKIHPQMTMLQRAAQFAPFAALTGHGAAIIETARLTDSQIELADEDKARLNKKLNILIEHIEYEPTITVTYFLSDTKKSGGSYQFHTGIVKRIDDYEQKIIMEDGTEIALQSIFEIEGTIFGNME